MASPCPCFRCTKERAADDPKIQAAMAVDPIGANPLGRMFLCATCGNKRCPHAADHRNACTQSNEPGQPGSLYEDAPTSIDVRAILNSPSVLLKEERDLAVAYMRHLADLRPADARGLRVIASDVEAGFHRDPDLNPRALRATPRPVQLSALELLAQLRLLADAAELALTDIATRSEDPEALPGVISLVPAVARAQIIIGMCDRLLSPAPTDQEQKS